MKVEKIKLKTTSPASFSRAHPPKIKQVAFQSEMRDAEEKQFKEFAEKLLSEIDKQGEVLSNNIALGEVEKYKNLIKKFLQEVVARTYQFERRLRVDASGYQKNLSIVKKINSEMEELTYLTLQKQKNKLSLLAKIGEIRGLLVDLIR